jgi:hypothetical protein
LLGEPASSVLGSAPAAASSRDGAVGGGGAPAADAATSSGAVFAPFENCGGASAESAQRGVIARKDARRPRWRRRPRAGGGADATDDDDMTPVPPPRAEASRRAAAIRCAALAVLATNNAAKAFSDGGACGGGAAEADAAATPPPRASPSHPPPPLPPPAVLMGEASRLRPQRRLRSRRSDRCPVRLARWPLRTTEQAARARPPLAQAWPPLVRLPPARPPPAAMRHAVAPSHIKSTPIRTNGSRSRPRTHRARAAHPIATARILTRAASGCGRAVTQWRRPKASKTAARPPPPGGAGAARRARIDGAAVWCTHAARAEGRARQRRAHARRLGASDASARGRAR